MEKPPKKPPSLADSGTVLNAGSGVKWKPLPVAAAGERRVVSAKGRRIGRPRKADRISDEQLRAWMTECEWNATHVEKKYGMSRVSIWRRTKKWEKSRQPEKCDARLLKPTPEPPAPALAVESPRRQVNVIGSDVLLQLERDLSTCTEAEMRQRWAGSAWKDAETLLSRQQGREVDFEAVLRGHNPIYYTAERAFFANKRALGNPRFLYAPYHREKLCAPILEHIINPGVAKAALVWLGPRDTYKTTFNHGAVPMWYAHRRKHLDGIDARIVLRHHKEDMASGNMVRLKNKYLQDEWVRRVWADACPGENTREFGTKSAFTLAWTQPGDHAESGFRAIGINSTDTGLHSDLDCGDDLETEDHLTSKKIRKDSQTRYEARRFQLDPEGSEVNTGTPYHPAGLWTWMENSFDDDGTPFYSFVKIPAIAARCPDCQHPTVADRDGDDNHLSAGRCTVCGCRSTAALAHPHKLSWSFLNNRRKQELGRSKNDNMWRRQYQIQIRADIDQIGDSSWLRECSLDDIPEGAWPVLPIDPAWKGTENHGEGDAAAGQMWMMARQGGVILRYLVDGFHSRELSSNDGELEIFRLLNKWGCRAVAPEETGGHTFRNQLRNAAISLGMPLQIIQLKLRQTNKGQRMCGFLKEAEAGRVFVVRDSVPPVVLNALCEQMDNYHPDMDDDDALDCAGYSCDPNIASAWAPAWNAGRRLANLSAKPAVNSPRTRHCSL